MKKTMFNLMGKPPFEDEAKTDMGILRSVSRVIGEELKPEYKAKIDMGILKRVSRVIGEVLKPD